MAWRGAVTAADCIKTQRRQRSLKAAADHHTTTARSAHQIRLNLIPMAPQPLPLPRPLFPGTPLIIRQQGRSQVLAARARKSCCSPAGQRRGLLLHLVDVINRHMRKDNWNTAPTMPSADVVVFWERNDNNVHNTASPAEGSLRAPCDVVTAPSTPATRLTHTL